MTATYPGIVRGTARWCQQCAGPVLAILVHHYDVTVRSVDAH